MKCQLCGKPADKLTPVLCMGKNGYRIQKLCEKCKEKVEKVEKDNEVKNGTVSKLQR